MDMQYQIRNLVANLKFGEALDYFKNNKHNYTADAIASNEYLTSDMLRCLRAIKAWDAGESYLKIYNIKINEYTSERVLDAYILLLYDRYKAENTPENPHEHISFSTLEKIIELIPVYAQAQSNFAKNFYSTLTLVVLKTECKKVAPNWSLIELFCSVIAPGKLSTKCEVVEIKLKGKTKSKELASVQEEWYAAYSKALFTNNKFDLCIKVSEQALRTIPKLHYSNEIWFARRIAQSLTKLGDFENALKKLEALIQKKEEWFMLFEMAKLHIKLGNQEKASMLLHKAILKPGDISFKVEVLEALGDNYAKQGKTALATEHYRLLVSIRNRKGWSVNPGLLKKAGLESLSQDSNLDSHTALLKQLRKIWRNAVPESPTKNERLYGVVKRLARPKEAGVDTIISGEDKRDYYAFIRKTNRIYSSLVPGFRLSFEVIKLSNKPLDKAIKIRADDIT